jgi:alpha-glucosidase
MPWTGGPNGGFTSPGVEPWLPLGDVARNVADQRDHPASTLHLTRDLIALRRERSDLHTGAYAPLEAPEGVWAWRRGDRTAVAVHHGASPADVEVGHGTVLLSADRSRDGERVEGTLPLRPWDAVVVELEA